MTKHACIALQAALIAAVDALQLEALTQSKEKSEHLDNDKIALQKKVEDYLNGLFMLEGTFAQVISKKGRTSPPVAGTFYMRRPPLERSKKQSRDVTTNKPHWKLDGLLIFIKLPHQTILVRNGIVQIVDEARQKTSNYKATSMPFIKLFSDHSLELKRILKSLRCDFSDNREYVTLNVGSNSEVVLLFTLYPNKNIKTLAGWSIKDPNGVITSVAFVEESIVANSDKLPPSELSTIERLIWSNCAKSRNKR
jgi:hypothetical protein